jgi:glycine/D-amino acid oxidase-like deaminating enzyme
MNAFSYWEHKHFWGFWDFIVIGSGITGLTSAIHIKKRNKNAKIAVFEKGVLPTGASTKNAGFACFGSVSEILDDLEKQSEESVFGLIEKRFRGLGELKKLLGEENIGLEETGSFEIFMNSETELYERCLGSLSYINAELVNTIGVQAFWDAGNRIGEFDFAGVDHMIVNKEEGVIDTGLMMKNLIALARSLEIEIWNGIEVLNVLGSRSGQVKIQTSLGEATCANAIIATNGFARKLLPDLDVQACRAQVLITKPVKNLKPKGAFHHQMGYNYFRHVDSRILFGGGRHLNKQVENTDSFGTTLEIQEYLEKILREVILPETEVEVDLRWSGIMGMGGSKEIILKEIMPNVVCAVRLGGMGVAIGTQLGKEVAELFLPE